MAEHPDDEIKVYLAYPDERMVRGRKIMSWAADAFANRETDQAATNLGEAIAILEDLGHITVDTGEAAARDAYLSPHDEPIDEHLAHLDRLDRWHGPQHG
jgi:hypothetical protein|tara:strand:- start:108 stop:407 length:300 start_codon:yes stop_codon:yes gene_type:complete